MLASQPCAVFCKHDLARGIPCVGSLCAACQPRHSLRRGRPILLACARAAMSQAPLPALLFGGGALPEVLHAYAVALRCFCKHDLPRETLAWLFFFVCFLNFKEDLFFFYGRSCLQKTSQGHNAGMQDLGKGAFPEEEGR